MPAAPSHEGCGWKMKGARGADSAMCAAFFGKMLENAIVYYI